jgi:hypothetical protein
LALLNWNKIDSINPLIPLSVIPISGTHCIVSLHLRLKMPSEAFLQHQIFKKKQRYREIERHRNKETELTIKTPSKAFFQHILYSGKRQVYDLKVFLKTYFELSPK